MKKIADALFLANAVYFVAMAVAHFLGIKYPVLFIYYDVPFYSYQDKIISFAVCAYIIVFVEAFRKPSLRLSAIILMYLTCAGLSSVNLSEELASVLTEGQSTLLYWIQTIAILMLTVCVHFTHIASKESKGKSL